jgi:putative flavoprotein involved in K+ transport
VVAEEGYRLEYSWIDAPIFDSSGRVEHRRGVTDVPGLFFLGLPWQHTRGSALIGWVKEDAEFIARQIEPSAKGRETEGETLDTPETTPAS